MPQYQELKIDGYRGLKNLHLKNLKQINILVGENNSGKTSVLEAIHLANNPLNPEILLSIADNKYDSLTEKEIDSLLWLFGYIDKDKRKPISIEGKINNKDFMLTFDFLGKNHVTPNEEMNIDFIKTEEVIDNMLASLAEELDFPIIIQEKIKDREAQKRRVLLNYFFDYNFVTELIDNNHLFTIENNELDLSLQFHAIYNPTFETVGVKTSDYINELDEILAPINDKFLAPTDKQLSIISPAILTKATKLGFKETLISVLNNFDKGIKNIEILVEEERHPYISIEHDTMGYVPLTTYGAGLEKSLAIMTALLNVHNGVLLIDEIETSIHINALKQVFACIVETCIKYDIQIFATTHSLEAIDAILKAVNDNNLIDNVAAYSLDNTKDNTYAKRYSGKSLYNIRYSLGQDIR